MQVARLKEPPSARELIMEQRHPDAIRTWSKVVVVSMPEIRLFRHVRRELREQESDMQNSKKYFRQFSSCVICNNQNRQWMNDS